MRFHSCLFVITPDELQTALSPFTLFISNRQVPVEYVCSQTEDFINSYRKLYALLKSGDPLNWSKHFNLFDSYSITTDISSIIYGKEHIRSDNKYKMYVENARGASPSFSPFTFITRFEKERLFVSTRASCAQFTDKIMGFQLTYPKISKAEAEHFGLDSEKDFESYKDYTLFSNYITKNTSALKIVRNGIEKKTAVRISDSAKKDLSGFYCIKNEVIVII